ncbi:MAG: LLM class F420-dependent oxidoreductase [Rhodospirillaceae bacterium]|nr:MAG: LLM class F420-dependent oxidoreductase [Rhodospirillaceae bacterium]
MKWSIQYANLGPFTDPELACLLAQTAEEAGFESLCACEHIVIPARYTSPYPFSSDGKMSDNDYASAQSIMPDPLIWIAYVAQATKRINFTTGVVILPLRNPVVFAKQLVTLDQLSKGRVSIGIGVGWLREEFDAVGVPWERRGARCDEYIAAMRALWSDGEASFQGEFANFQHITMTPKPVHKRGIPIVIGGHGEIAARRAGRLGDGFFPAIFPNTELWARLPGLIQTMRQAAMEAGRNPDDIEITSGGTRRVENVGRFEELGVTRMVIRVHSRDPKELRDELLRFGDEVIAKT